jgi:Domain of unknown function (DUF4169)
MAEIFNLKRARKAQAKTKAEQEAARNRSVYGMSRAERERLRMVERDAQKHLDQYRLEPKNEE